MTNTGAFFFQGAISNNLVNSGSVTLNDNATITVAPVNTGTINASASTLNVTPAWANAGTLLLGGGFLVGGNTTNNSGALLSGFGTVSNRVVNLGVITATNGILTFTTAPVQSGTINVTGSGTLNVLQAWRNSGTVTLLGGTVIGSTLTNSVLVTGYGAITAALVNNATVTATNGELRLLGAVSGAGAYRAVAAVCRDADICGQRLDQRVVQHGCDRARRGTADEHQLLCQPRHAHDGRRHLPER